jgi:predicted phosphodiesterase
MRIALLSDVHGNLPAFDAVLADVEAAEPDEVWCLGDLVGYGAQPDACVERAQERCDLVLAGNHDLVVTGDIDIADFSASAAAAARWTRETIGDEALTFLRGLSPSEAGRAIGLYHASPRDPIWEYVISTDQAEAGFDAQEERVGLIGHSHIALFFCRAPGVRPGYAQGAQADDGLEIELPDGQWLLNPGSVGQPRDGDPRAAWLELDTRAWTARWHRVDYDVGAAAAAIRTAGLPPALADRLEVGR